MKTTLMLTLAMVTGLLMMSSLAHHGGGIYDIQNPITLKGES